MYSWVRAIENVLLGLREVDQLKMGTWDRAVVEVGMHNWDCTFEIGHWDGAVKLGYSKVVIWSFVKSHLKLSTWAWTIEHGRLLLGSWVWTIASEQLGKSMIEHLVFTAWAPHDWKIEIEHLRLGIWRRPMVVYSWSPGSGHMMCSSQLICSDNISDNQNCEDGIERLKFGNCEWTLMMEQLVVDAWKRATNRERPPHFQIANYR